MTSLILTLAIRSQAAQPSQILWRIGESDDNTAEFALAPKDCQNYSKPAFFLIGESEPGRDWPYVLPGPADGSWAPDAPQAFEIVFGLKEAPLEACRLVLDFVDTHSVSPPTLKVDVNGSVSEHATPTGGGDASVFGDPGKGRECVVTIDLPAEALKAGNNRLAISIVSGSWALWDSVQFAAPADVRLAPVEPETKVLSLSAEPALVRRSGEEAQPIHVQIAHIGTSEKATVRIGERETTADLRPGNQEIEALASPVKELRSVEIEILCGGKTIARETVDQKPVRRWEIHIVHQTHLDIGFTHRQEDVLEQQVQHLRTALEYIERTRDYPPEARFVWHPEGMWAIEEFMRVASAEEKQRFLSACRAGQIHIDALYAQAMTGMYSEEELMELVSAAKRFGAIHGVPVVSAMQSDVPGYTWGLSAVLAHNGVPYLSVGPNWFAKGDADNYFLGENIVGQTHRGGRVFRWADQPFWWESPSGKQKTFFWMPGWGYSGFHGDRGAISKEKVFAYLSYLEGKQYPYDMVMWRYGIGADNGPPSPDLCDIVKAWNEKYSTPRLIVAQNSKVMQKFVERYRDAIPVLKGDYTPYWEDGAASTAKATGASRRAAERLAQAQILWAMLRPDAPLRERFDTAWNKLIMYDEHTWGAHNSIGEPDDPFAVQQDEYKQAYAFDGADMSRTLLEDATHSGAEQRVADTAIDVFNTASWARDGLVLLTPEQSAAGDRIVGADGADVPSQRLASGVLAFVARGIPALGAARYTVSAGVPLQKGDATAEALRVQNSLLQIEIDPASGAIRSLRRKGMDGDLVDASAYAGLNDYLYIIGRDADKNRARVNGPVAVAVEDSGPVVATLRIESDAPGCRKLTRRVRVIDGLDYVELINTPDKLKERRPEGLYFGFPFDLPGATMRVDVPWAVVEMEKDQLPGANRNFCCVQRWVDLSTSDRGVTWVTVDAPMLQFEPIKIAQPFGLEHWRERFNPPPFLWSWTMNNHWETNYKADQEGEIEFRYVLRPHAGGYDPASAQRFGRDVCQPLLALSADPEREAPGPLLELEGEGIVLTSIRPSRQGKAYIARLFSTADKKQEVALRWNRKVGKTWISNPMEEAVEEAPPRLRLAPLEIVTLLAERRD